MPVRPSLDQGYMREQSRLEQMIGPEWYRLAQGLVTNPLSVAGILICGYVRADGAVRARAGARRPMSAGTLT